MKRITEAVRGHTLVCFLGGLRAVLLDFFGDLVEAVSVMAVAVDLNGVLLWGRCSHAGGDGLLD